jgi:uncharacterized membrane protein
VAVTLRYTFAIFAVLLLGLLAGILVGTGMDHFVATGLPAKSWTAWRQVNGWVFPTIMPWIFNVTLLVSAAAAVFNRGRARWFFIAAALLTAGSIFVTVRLEVPMNHAISGWTPGAEPPDWSAIREQWLRNHFVRSTASVAAFICGTVGLARH